MSCWSRGSMLASAIVAAVAAASMGSPAPAEAAYPGTNGRIVMERLGEIHTVLTNGNADRQLTGFATREPVYSPDGSRIAYMDGRDLWVMNADGTRKRQVTISPSTDRSPTWHPDGTRLAFERDKAAQTDIFAVNVNGTGLKNLTRTDTKHETDPAWSPLGTQIAYTGPGCDDGAGSCIYVMNADGTSAVNITPDERPAGCDLGSTFRSDAQDPAWHPNGRVIAFSTIPNCGDSGLDIWTITPTGTILANLIGDDDTSDTEPAFSPNGARLVFEKETVVDSYSELHTINASSGWAGGHVQITDNDDWDYTPDWQPVPVCTITGDGDSETLNGTPGNDVICGNGGNDTIDGKGGADILLGGGGNDILVGGGGNDILNGGAGTDTAKYAGGGAAVSANLTTGFAASLSTGNDVLLAVENLTGSSFSDTLRGSGGANVLVGGKGADKLYGQAGNDRLDARDSVNGNDSLYGGTGSDTCLKDATEAVVSSCP